MGFAGLNATAQLLRDTPMSEDLSAGIVAFDIEGYTTKKAVKRLFEKKVIATEDRNRLSEADALLR